MVRHANANVLDVMLAADEDVVRLVVSDDGRGFDVEATQRTTDGYGLRNLRERVEREGGTIRIESSHETGTTVIVELRPGG